MDELLLWELDSGDPGGRYPNGRGRNEGAEGFGGHHGGVAERAEVCPVTHLFDLAKTSLGLVTPVMW